jgi:hypothetical protein
METQGYLGWEIQGDLKEKCREIGGIYSEIRRDTGRSTMKDPVEI